MSPTYVLDFFSQDWNGNISNFISKHTDMQHWHISLCFSEKGNVRVKIETLKKVICMILNGEKMSPSMLMTVIRFVMPLQDHTIKKMLLIFWEVVPKYSQDGKMLQEIILVCDAYRKVRFTLYKALGIYYQNFMVHLVVVICLVK